MIDFKKAVESVYPDADMANNETVCHYATLCWITDGHGNEISDKLDSSLFGWSRAWENAYNNLLSQGKIKGE